MKRDAFLFFTLALITAAIALADNAGNAGDTALILSFVFLTLTAVALFVVRPLPACPNTATEYWVAITKSKVGRDANRACGVGSTREFRWEEPLWSSPKFFGWVVRPDHSHETHELGSANIQ